MHPTLYQAVSTVVTVLALTAGLIAQRLEFDRTRPLARAGVEASARRWNPPQGLPGHPATAAETYFTIDR